MFELQNSFAVIRATTIAPAEIKSTAYRAMARQHQPYVNNHPQIIHL